MTAAVAEQPKPIAGMISFAAGALALLMVLAHFWNGPIAPQQRVGVTVGEIAGDIRQSAIRKLKGQPPPAPVAEPWTIDKTLKLIAALLAGTGVVAGAASYVRKERLRAAVAGTVLGASAITFQLFTWSILMIAGAIIIYAIIHNIGDILGDNISGIFGG